MNELKISTTERYFSVPEKLYILAALAKVLLTDAKAIISISLALNG